MHFNFKLCSFVENDTEKLWFIWNNILQDFSEYTWLVKRIKYMLAGNFAKH